MSMSRGGRGGPPIGGPAPQSSGTDSGAVLRLLGTIREEIEQIRTKQAEIYEVVLSYKHQLQELKTTVLEKLEGLPKSPYIAGQLVPMPRKRDGVDDFRDLLATYLHPAPPGSPQARAEEEEDKPVDVDLTPESEPPADTESLEDEEDSDEDEDDDRRDRRRRRDERRGPLDEDTRGLSRGPERDVEPFDLHPQDRPARQGDEADEGEGAEGEAPRGGEPDEGGDEQRGPRRRRRRRRSGGGGPGDRSSGGERRESRKPYGGEASGSPSPRREGEGSPPPSEPRASEPRDRAERDPEAPPPPASDADDED